jgi:hypothetical protein
MDLKDLKGYLSKSSGGMIVFLILKKEECTKLLIIKKTLKLQVVNKIKRSVQGRGE